MRLPRLEILPCGLPSRSALAGSTKVNRGAVRPGSDTPPDLTAGLVWYAAGTAAKGQWTATLFVPASARRAGRAGAQSPSAGNGRASATLNSGSVPHFRRPAHG